MSTSNGRPYERPHHVVVVGADFRWLRLSGLPAWPAWLLVHLFFLIGMQNRLLVVTRWVFSYLTRSGGARLITGSEVNPAARAVAHS